MQQQQKFSPVTTSFNQETHIKELQERFGRLIKKMGPNTRKGTLRYNYEVEFMYSLNEIRLCPPYLQGKMFENASTIVTSLVNLIQLKQSSEKGGQLIEE